MSQLDFVHNVVNQKCPIEHARIVDIIEGDQWSPHLNNNSLTTLIKSPISGHKVYKYISRNAIKTNF